MANNKYITVDQLNNVISKIDKNFSKKKDSLTKVELKELKVADFPNGEITQDGLYLVETYVDHGILESDGVTTRVHVDYIGVNVELGTSIEDWTSGKDYKVNDLVIVNGTKLYRCKTAPQVDNTTFDKDEWTKISSSEIYTETIDQTSFALNSTSGLYEYEFNNPFGTNVILCSLQKVSDNSLMLDTIEVTDTKIKVLLNTPESVIINIIGGDGVDETTILKDALTPEQLRLLGVVQAQEDEITSLKVEELYEDSTNPTEVTGYKILFKEKDSLGNIDITSELIQEKDFAKKFIDDTISKTDPKASQKLLSAKYVLDAIDLLSGVDMSSFAKKDDVYYHHTTYTRCLQTDDGAKEVVSVVTDNATQVSYDDVILQITDITLNEWVKEGITYDNALYVEKESDLYKNILSQFAIETLKEDVSDPDLITGYILKYRNKKIFTEDNLEITDLDFDTLDTI